MIVPFVSPVSPVNPKAEIKKFRLRLGLWGSGSNRSYHDLLGLRVLGMNLDLDFMETLHKRRLWDFECRVQGYSPLHIERGFLEGYETNLECWF